MQVFHQPGDDVPHVVMHEREQAEAGDEHQRALGEFEQRDDAQLRANQPRRFG